MSTKRSELVSIVICTYNGALYIEEQIESILNQTYKKIEVIVADDASSDNTFDILQRYASDERVRLYRNETNVGYNINFSQACEKAQGAYIAIADQDDIWELNKIELLYNAITSDPSITLVHGISARFEKQGKPHLASLKCLNNYTGNDIRNFYLKNVISGHSMLFRSCLLKRALPFPPEVYYDWWLVANACVAGKIKAVEKILVWHRMHSNNATGAAKPKVHYFKQQQIILSNLVQIPGINQDAKALAESLLHYYQEFPRKRFSFFLFLVLLKYSSTVFAYKRRHIPSLSYLKYAYKFAHKETLA